MKTKSKRILACAMSGLMVAGAFAGCSQTDTGTTTAAEQAKQTTAAQKEEATEEVTEAPEIGNISGTVADDGPVKLRLFGQVTSYTGIQPGWMGQILREKFNVELEYINNVNGTFGVLMDQEDLGDIVVWGCYCEDYQTAIDKGLLLDLNKDNLLENHGSYIKANLTDSLDDNMAKSGGVCYGFNGSCSAENSVNAEDLFQEFDVRWDLYNELGQPAVADYDDLLQLMIDMKKLCPVDEKGNETYAFPVFRDWDIYNQAMTISLASAYSGSDFDLFFMKDGATGEVSAVTQKNGPYYEALKFVNALYRNGLVNPNAKQEDYTVVSDDVKAGRYLMSPTDYLGRDLYNTDEHIAENKMMLPIMPSEAKMPVRCSNTVGNRGIFTIGAKTEHAELCMEILNWLATPEGTLTIIYGPRGICWDVDADGYLYLTDLGRTYNLEDRYTEITYDDIISIYGEGILMLNANVWSYSSQIPSDTAGLDLAEGQSYYFGRWKNEQGEASCDLEEAWRTYAGCNSVDEYILKNDNSLYMPYHEYIQLPESGDIASKYEAVGKVVVDGSWACIYADSDEKFEELFDKMAADADAAGLEECYQYIVESFK
ncbi:MAG: hypothetical protein K6F92_05860 [Lachnospiraceae bacterium]|nr:hypothetical protein [Lachnospiraceae bacterium]